MMSKFQKLVNERKEFWKKKIQLKLKEFGLSKNKNTKEVKSAQFYEWEGEIYKIDLDAPANLRILVKEGDKFISKPNIGKLATDIEFYGMPIDERDINNNTNRH